MAAKGEDGADTDSEDAALPAGEPVEDVQKHVSDRSTKVSSWDGNTQANNIRVAVRIRPFNAREQSEVGNTEPVMQVSGNSIMLDQERCPMTSYSARDKNFNFDHVFSSIDRTSPDYATQEKVFDAVGFPILENAFNALNGCLLAYGQTGSGKSYSILGDASSDVDKGILPRACGAVFRMMAEKRAAAQEAGEKWQATVLVSYLEIYQEKMFDLLVSHSKRADLHVRVHPTLGPHVPQLTECPVTSIEGVEELLDFGSKNRAVSATSMNAQSSRSHAVFSLELRLNLCGKDQQSKIHFVDLAGSEKQKKTEAEGARLQEGIAINQSLSTLSRVIMSLAAQAQPEENVARRKSMIATPPFRESKLTLLLKEALSGNSRTVLVACVSPSQVNAEESLSTLEFASRCKLIKTSAKKNEQSKKDLIESLSAEKKMIEEQLQVQLAQRKALQEKLECEAERSKQSHEFAERMKEEKLAIERQLHDMLSQSSMKGEGEKKRTKPRWMVRANTAPFVEMATQMDLAETSRSDKSWGPRTVEVAPDKQVPGAELKQAEAMGQLEQTLTLQGSKQQEWTKQQQESQMRGGELQDAVRQHAMGWAERERLEQEQQQCLEEAERLRCEREQQLNKLEEDKALAVAQLRELREQQEADQAMWQAQLAEKEKQAKALQQARDTTAEQVAKEHLQRVERLQREKAEELSQAGADHRQAVAQLQDKLAAMEAAERTERESASNSQARETELRRHIELDLRSHEAREEELLKELRSIQSLSDSWALEKQDFERRGQEQKRHRERLLRDLGIMGMDQQAINSRTSARLVNLHPDPMLEGCLVYYLPKGETQIGADNKRCRVWLTGLDVGDVVCAISNQEDKTLTVRALQGGLVRVNGVLVTDTGQLLQNGDRLAIGRAHIFRAVIPEAARRNSVVERKEREFEQAMHELQECAEIDPRWRRRVDGAVLIVKREFGTVEAKALLDKAKAASEAVAEANALVRSLPEKPVNGCPRYELSLLFEADSPPVLCVICRCDASEDGLGDVYPASEEPGPAQQLPATSSVGLGMLACSAGIWEAGRFTSERLPHMRWIAEQVRLEGAASDPELRRQLFSADDWESRTAGAAAKGRAEKVPEEGEAAASRTSEVGWQANTFWSFWMSTFCTGAHRGSFPFQPRFAGVHVSK